MVGCFPTRVTSAIPEASTKSERRGNPKLRASKSGKVWDIYRDDDGGGKVAATGKPENVAKVAASYTDRYFAPMLNARKVAAECFSVRDGGQKPDRLQ